MNRLRDPALFGDPEAYERVYQGLQTILARNFSESPHDLLFWDGLTGSLSPNRKRDWHEILTRPTRHPVLRFLREPIREILTWNPDQVILTALSDTQILPLLAIAALMKREQPQLLLRAGGQAFRQRCGLASRDPLLRECFAEVNETFFSGIFPEPECGAGELACPSPAYALLSLKQYFSALTVLPVFTALGCPWSRCAFCNHPVQPPFPSRHYFPRPLSQVLDEIEWAVGQGITLFFLVDEAVSPERLQAFAEGVMARKLTIHWLCYSRLEDGHTAERLVFLHSAGCRKIYYGLESGSQSILDRFAKGIQADTARRVLRDLGQAGIACHLFLMTGFPGESRSDQDATLELLRATLPFLPEFGFSYDLFPLAYERGTPLGESPQNFGALLRQNETMFDYSFRFSGGPPIDVAARSYEEFQFEVSRTVETALGKQFGLRHLRLNQDSNHLPLILAQLAFLQSG
jgi:hypothetical protein